MPEAHPIIDLRSDTVTRPTPAMRLAMAEAEVGDDVLGDDPTVLRLQDRVAELLNKPAAVFVPSGSMANQTAIRAHTQPGDEIACHEDSHIIHYETGGPAALSGVMIRPLAGADGQFDAPDLLASLRPFSAHFPHTTMMLIENTHNRCGGAVWPIDKVRRVTDAARGAGLKRHLDGARLWNACAKSGLAPADYAACFDTVSCCFSKGLGAPVGSAVVGDKDTLARVHRFRKMFGGAMRQAGILAAAALHALEHHRARLADDHANARRLGELLANVPGLSLAYPVHTNMVFVDLGESIPEDAAAICARLRTMNVLALPNKPRRIRLVCHLDVHDSMIEPAARALASAVQAARGVAPRAQTPVLA